MARSRRHELRGRVLAHQFTTSRVAGEHLPRRQRARQAGSGGRRANLKTRLPGSQAARYLLCRGPWTRDGRAAGEGDETAPPYAS